MTLSPGFKAVDLLSQLLHRLGRLPGPEALTTVTYEERRRNAPAAWMVQRPPTGITSRDVEVPARGGDVRVRTYTRDSGATGAGVVYVHGGGFVLGGVEACHHLMLELCHTSGATIVSVDYRLAPEFPFPAGLEDCEDALLWTVKQADELGIDPDRIVVAGDSAGGNLAAALSLKLRDEGGPTVRGQILIYPVLDFSLSQDSWDTEARPWMNRTISDAVFPTYFAGTDALHPLCSPLSAGDLSGLPPALIQVAEHDCLRGDGEAYALRLEEAGVPVRFTSYLGAPHGFLQMPRIARQAAQARREISDEIVRRTR